jgi:hypothetical protein
MINREKGLSNTINQYIIRNLTGIEQGEEAQRSGNFAKGSTGYVP